MEDREKRKGGNDGKGEGEKRMPEVLLDTVLYL